MDSHQIRVLLIEDDEDDYVITRDLLSEIGDAHFDLEWVTTYEKAIPTIDEGRHDICLLDYNLGESNGVAILREVVEKGCRTPIIMLTGQGHPEVDIEAMKAGASDYLVKGRIDAGLLGRSIRYAIERAQLMAAMRELAIRDELTGLYNRRQLSDMLSNEIERAYRYSHPMSLLMIDIDHFKLVNDTYGHPIGDAVLKWLADKVRDNVRSLDHPARYGGEEFAVILTETPGSGAMTVAESLRKAIGGKPFTFMGHGGTQVSIPLSISLGIASVPNDGADEHSLIASADQALYEAKRQGRNRTVHFASMNLPVRVAF